MSAPKSFTLDGRRYRIDTVIPQSSIRWLIGQLHCGETDASVARLMYRRLRAARRDGSNAASEQWTRARRKQAVRYALKCHRDNQRLYRLAMGRV